MTDKIAQHVFTDFVKFVSETGTRTLNQINKVGFTNRL